MGSACYSNAKRHDCRHRTPKFERAAGGIAIVKRTLGRKSPGRIAPSRSCTGERPTIKAVVCTIMSTPPPLPPRCGYGTTIVGMGEVGVIAVKHRIIMIGYMKINNTLLEPPSAEEEERID